MSFIHNISNNDTMKYWSKKLKWKWYNIPFLLTKNIEVDIFTQNLSKQNKIQNENITIQENKNYDNNIKEIDKDSIVVIIPFFISNNNGLTQMIRLLESLNNQTLSPKAIIIVDDGSTFSYKLPRIQNLEIVVLQKNSGPANARNIGIKKAMQKYNPKIIAFTDSDVIVHNKWLENIFHGFKNLSNAAALSGHTYSLKNTWFDLYHSINGTLNGRIFNNTNLLLYAPTCNLAIIADCLKTIQFDTDFPCAAGEDIHLCFQFLQNNYPIIFDNKIIVYHDFGYEPFKILKNIDRFKKLFVKYSKGENILLNKIPNYYLYLKQTKEISNLES